MPINNDLTITYKIPSDIKEYLSRDFMSHFYKRVIETFKQNDINQGREPYRYEDDTYYSWWAYVGGTSGFCNTFREVCEKHSLQHVLRYYNALYWYDRDLFDYELMDLLIEYGFIEKGFPEEFGAEQIK